MVLFTIKLYFELVPLQLGIVVYWGNTASLDDIVSCHGKQASTSCPGGIDVMGGGGQSCGLRLRGMG